MLSSTHFYYQTIRRSVVLFGNLFKDIVLVRYSNDVTRAEINRQTVPLVYGGKEDYWIRTQAQPDLPPAADINLPTASFSLTGIDYDASRKQQSLLQNFYKPPAAPSGTISTQYTAVPYNLKFTLWVYVRNVEDGTQIVEQILPWFNPDYTMTMNFVDDMNISRNVPITLNDVAWENDYEGPAKSTMRSVIWTLNFTMPVYFYGPINDGGTIIKTATANILTFGTGVSDVPAYTQLSLANTGLLVYKSGETVYQGESLPYATAIGTVVNYSANTLIVTDVRGAFVPNANIHGSLSAASWNVVAVPASTNLVSIIETVVPPSANLGDDFGYSTQIKEFPLVQ